MSTDAFEQLIDVAAPGGGSYPVQRGHRRGVRSPHTFDAARWPPSSLTSPYAPQGSTTAVLGRFMAVSDDLSPVRCERCGHEGAYHWLAALKGERRCVWNPEECACFDFVRPPGVRRHLRSV